MISMEFTRQSGANGVAKENNQDEIKTKMFTVKEITHYIKTRLETDDKLRNIWMKAEITNVCRHTSGHLYFSMKDEDAVLSCVMFRRANELLDFQPEPGVKVIAKGSINVYPPRGSYQLIIEEMYLEGRGDLYKKYILLKNKLEKEGLFLKTHKKSLPGYPERIGIVTSISGAAIKDILRTIGQRFPAAEIIIASATKIIQGSFEDGVVVAITDRVISGAATIVLGNIFIWTIIRKMGESEGR